MLNNTISQKRCDVQDIENFSTIDCRQKRYSLDEKLEFITYLFQRRTRMSKSNLSRYAEVKGVSRTTLYQLEQGFRDSFEADRPGPKCQNLEAAAIESKEDRHKIEVTKERVIRSILQAAVSPMSSEDIQRQLEVDFDLRISRHKIKKIIAQYSRKAAGILHNLKIEPLVKYMAIDEIFCASDVILTGVDMPSMALVINKPESGRAHKIWQAALSPFVNLELVTSDRGKGIIKGVELYTQVAHQFDLFHFKRDAHRQLRHLEAMAYRKIELEYQAQEKLHKAKETASGERQASYQKCRQEASLAIDSFDQADRALEMIEKSLEIWEDGELLDLSKNRKMLESGANLLAKSSRDSKIQNLAAQVRDPHLSLYLEKLQNRLLDIIVRYNKGCQPIPRKKLFGMIASSWYWEKQSPRPVSSFISKERRKAAREQSRKDLYWQQIAASLQLREVQMQLANFDEVRNQIVSALDCVFRASSPVEAINSHLRLYQQVKKYLSKDFLSLLTLYWNMHTFSGGKRKGKSPFQILGIQKSDESWLDLLLSA